MRKAVYIFCLILQTALVAGAYVINYFAKSRMGMMRWLNQRNQFWAKALPLDELKIAVLVVIVLATALLFVLAVRRFSQLKGLSRVIMLATLIALCAYCYFVFSNNVTLLKSYYYMTPLFSIAMLLQLIKAFASLKLVKQRKA